MNFFIPDLNIGAIQRWCRCFQCRKDRFCFRAVLFAQHTHIRDNSAAICRLWHIVLDEDGHGSTALCSMSVQIIVGPVGYPYGFYPAKTRRENFRIPAIGCIMRPFIREMLTEPESFRSDPDSDQKFMSKGNVIGDVLIGNYTFVDGFPHRHFHQVLTFLLLDVGK
jgi:hypothetical protein